MLKLDGKTLVSLVLMPKYERFYYAHRPKRLSMRRGRSRTAAESVSGLDMNQRPSSAAQMHSVHATRSPRARQIVSRIACGSSVDMGSLELGRLLCIRKTYTKMDQIRVFRVFSILWVREWSRFVWPNPFELFATRLQTDLVPKSVCSSDTNLQTDFARGATITTFGQ